MPKTENTRLARKDAFIRALAEYLTHGLAAKSILLEMGNPEAKAWAKCWNASTLFGYPSAEESEAVLRDLLC